MENKSENTETAVVDTVVDIAVDKADTAVASVESITQNDNQVEPIVEKATENIEEKVVDTLTDNVETSTEDATNQATITVPVTLEEGACDQSECNPYVRIGVIIIIAIIILIVLSCVIKSKKKKNTGKGNKKSFKSNPNAVEIYVGNLSYEMGNSELRKEFEKFGIVTSARIIVHRNSRKSKGYGFVEMPHRSEAEEAIRALNNKDIKGRKIHVNEARANTKK